jgi:NifU-like protein involved in Fe-S cluster formation
MTPAVDRGALYTPELLALAVSLADCPLDPEASLVGDARSATCGSNVTVTFALGPDERVAEVGLRASACAVGQAAAALFVRSAMGRDREEIAAERDRIADWLRGGEMPSWPGLEALAPARSYPARHGAILVPWDAALAALSKAAAPG